MCKTLSPSTESVDRGKKLRIYAREGVGHSWLINLANETLEVFRLRAATPIFRATLAG